MARLIPRNGLDRTFNTVLNPSENVPLFTTDDLGLTPMDAKNRIALIRLLEETYKGWSINIDSILSCLS